MQANALTPFEQFRERRRSELKPNSISQMTFSELLNFEIALGTKLGDNPIVLPENWFPAGRLQSLSKRTIDISNTFPSKEFDHSKEKESLLRMLLALWLIPRQTQTGMKRYGPSSYAQYSSHLIKLCGYLITNFPSTTGQIFAHIDPADLKQAVWSWGGFENRATNSVLIALTQFRERGIIDDAPNTPAPQPVKSRPEKINKKRPITKEQNMHI